MSERVKGGIGIVAKTTLDRVVEEIKTLEPEELLRLRDQLDAIIDSDDEARRRGTVRQALREAGLVTRARRPRTADIPNRPLILAQGKPVSETIIEDRR